MTNRAHRLRRLLANEETISAEDFRRIKYDLSYDEDASGMPEFIAYLQTELAAEDADLQEAFELLKSWDYSTRIDSRSAALAMLTAQPLLDFRHAREDVDLSQQLREASAYLMQHFGRIDPTYGELNRLRRGDQEWPIDGGPDILRAVYTTSDEETGKLLDVAGDSYIMFVEWDKDGKVSSTSVHSFGSATLDESSPHYADQSPLFVEMREKPVHLELEEVLQHATRDYSP
jgi:acyl-homoserine-lactone acylase